MNWEVRKQYLDSKVGEFSSVGVEGVEEEEERHHHDVEAVDAR